MMRNMNNRLNSNEKSMIIVDTWDIEKLEMELYVDSSMKPDEWFFIEPKEPNEYFGLDPVESFGDWADYLDNYNFKLNNVVNDFEEREMEIETEISSSKEEYYMDLYERDFYDHHGDGPDLGPDREEYVNSIEHDICGCDENWELDQLESQYDGWIEQENFSNIDYNYDEEYGQDEEKDDLDIFYDSYIDSKYIEFNKDINDPEEDQLNLYLNDKAIKESLCGLCGVNKPLNEFSADKLNNICDSCFKDQEDHLSYLESMTNLNNEYMFNSKMEESTKFHIIKNSNSLIESKNSEISSNRKLKNEHKTNFDGNNSPDGIYKDIIRHFPKGMTPRPEQKKILKKIAKGIEDGYHIFLLDAGTGIGKSAIAATLAEYFGKAFITTVTKQLQDQYKEDFNYPVMKGRSNFDCKEALTFHKTVSCEDGICQTEKNIHCHKGITGSEGSSFCFEDRNKVIWDFKSSDHCNYWKQKGKAVRSPITLMNYASFIIEMNYLSHFKKRKFCVFDEAHNIERLIMDRVSLKLSNKKLKSDFKDHIDDITPEGEIKFIPQISNDAFVEDKEFWIAYLSKFIEDYRALTKIEDLPKKKKKQFRTKLIKLQNTKFELIENSQKWIIEAKKDEKKVIFKPIEVSNFVKDYCFKHSDYSLLMSATILNKEHFCEWHGIDPDDVLYINVKSPFKVDKRPIYLQPVGSMSRKIIERTKPMTIPILKEILDQHKHEKGLIHTNSHELASYVYKKVNDPRLINYSISKSDEGEKPVRDKVIMEYIESKEPLVLVAPSVDEGVDFPDDLCRFQVIYKVPYPYLEDKQVKARNRIDPNWYAYQTVVRIVQAYGRGMRNKDDYCDTYIIDEDIFDVLFEEWRRFKQYIPKYFLEALIDPDGIIKF